VARGRMWTAGIYDERRRGWLFPGELGGTNAQFSAQGRRIYHPNDWNHLRIEARGDSIKTFLNGVLCADIKDSLRLKGLIGLQVHASNNASVNGAQVRFKNIRLKPASSP
jgi:3-keto-disaccharide hydrolase